MVDQMLASAIQVGVVIVIVLFVLRLIEARRNRRRR